MSNKNQSHGAQEWSVKTVNCCTGCSHDCLYCYAKEMAIRFKQVTAAQWPHERIRLKDVSKVHKKYDGQVMFPSSHDITPNNLNACLTVLKCLLVVGNKMLVVRNPTWNVLRRFVRCSDLIGEGFYCGFRLAPAMIKSYHIGSQMHPHMMNANNP